MLIFVQKTSMDRLIYLLLPLLFFMMLLHAHIMNKYIVETMQYTSNVSFNTLDAIFKLAGLYFCWRLHVPVYLLYILLLISYCTTFSRILKSSKLHYYFWIFIHFISMVSLHLICLSCVALITANSLRDTYQNKILWLIVMVMAVGFMNLLEYVFMRGNPHEKIRILTNDAARFREFIHFEWYAIAYLFFDSMSCTFQLPYEILPVFLIGSCVLLYLQVLLFLMHTYKIIEKAHYEAEYYRLEQERANHVKSDMMLRKLAYIDSLTGTFTRRYAMEMLESMQKDHKCVTIAYMDVNGLKKINDTLGHLEGDRYLITIAKSLNKCLRKNDVLARIGGDEFLIVSPDTPKTDLEVILEQANGQLSKEKIGSFQPSFSYGIAESLVGNAFDIEELLKESDKQMYAYKMEYKKEGTLI